MKPKPTPVRLRRGCAAAAAAAALIAPAFAGPASAVTALPARASTPSPGTGTETETASDTDFPQLTPAVAARLDAAVRRVMRETHTPGMAAGLWAPGKGSYVRAFGVADTATGAPMTTDLRVRIGSETKTFTVTALLQLVDRGRVRLDDTIGRYVKGVPNGDRITLRDLAGMRSGLFSYSLDEEFVRRFEADPLAS